VKRIPQSKWVWCGYPGHFVAAEAPEAFREEIIKFAG